MKDAFTKAWAKEGRRYGPDALEQVQLGWEIAVREIAEWLRGEGEYGANGTIDNVSGSQLANQLRDEFKIRRRVRGDHYP